MYTTDVTLCRVPGNQYVADGSSRLRQTLSRVSGTHWMYRVIDMLQRGQAVYDKRSVESTFLDLQRIELISELDSPRLLGSHVPFDLLPEQVKAKRTKMVHVYRNPRAVLVSFYFHMKSSNLAPGMTEEDLAFNNTAARFFSDKSMCGVLV